MAITRVQVGVIPYALPEGLYNPMQSWETAQRIPVVAVHDDSGCVGVGQCRGPVGAIKGLAEEMFAPLLLGEDPLCVRRLWERMYKISVFYEGRGLPTRVLGALDVAHWDLMGQLLGKPIHLLLGRCCDRVFAYASAGLYGAGKTTDDLAAEMSQYVARGFRAVKMKVGGAPLEEDVRRVRAVREAIGPEARLIVDAAYALTAHEAVMLARAIEQYDILFLEAPVAVEHPEALSAIKRFTTIPIAGNELVSTRFGFRELIADRRVDIVQPNLTTVGGITEAFRVVDTASTFGLTCSLQSSGELELLGSLHLAAAHPSVTSVEYHMLHRYLPPAMRDTVLRLADGHLQLPTGPGLGFPARDELMGMIRET